MRVSLIWPTIRYSDPTPVLGLIMQGIEELRRVFLARGTSFKIHQFLTMDFNYSDRVHMRMNWDRWPKLRWYEPRWERYGKRAGPLSNALMLKRSDACIVIWTGGSKAAETFLKQARYTSTRKYLPIIEYEYDPYVRKNHQWDAWESQYVYGKK